VVELKGGSVDIAVEGRGLRNLYQVRRNEKKCAQEENKREKTVRGKGRDLKREEEIQRRQKKREKNKRARRNERETQRKES